MSPTFACGIGSNIGINLGSTLPRVRPMSLRRTGRAPRDAPSSTSREFHRTSSDDAPRTGGDPATLETAGETALPGLSVSEGPSERLGKNNAPKPSRNYPGMGRLNHGFSSEWKLLCMDALESAGRIDPRHAAWRRKYLIARTLRAMRQPPAIGNQAQRADFVRGVTFPSGEVEGVLGRGTEEGCWN